ncbi:hypothetical protein THRCLA_02785 [Thraustotheca clavata]|uniref:Secreted protein n=1 Tax=Thraustotheca clavata TaxID=74557 RepID=A0A1W0A439_9STRA|nr:hypothetical protein THRCLA_02785 [Thraustotheca clavata]
MKTSFLALTLAYAVNAQYTDCSTAAITAIDSAIGACAKSANISTQYTALAVLTSLTDPKSSLAQKYCNNELPGCNAFKPLSTQNMTNCNYNAYKGYWVNLYTVLPKLCDSVTTTAPVTSMPTPTTATPTTSTPSTTKAPNTTAPAIITVTPVVTSNNATKGPSTKCIDVSVVGDATYCISGPICSGDGILPAGIKCPVKGDVAVTSCLSKLKSYNGGSCVLPVHSVCQKIPSGAWGCVMSTAQ